MLEIVAGVVLTQPAQPVPDFAGGQDYLEAQHEFARVPVAQYRRTARVRREVPADFAAALGGEAQGEQASGLLRGLLNVGQHAASLGGQGIVANVDRANAVHARKVEDDLRAARVGGRRPAQTRVSTLGDDTRASI